MMPMKTHFANDWLQFYLGNILGGTQSQLLSSKNIVTPISAYRRCIRRNDGFQYYVKEELEVASLVSELSVGWSTSIQYVFPTGSDFHSVSPLQCEARTRKAVKGLFNGDSADESWFPRTTTE